MSDSITGGCQCGAVRYRFLAPPENAHACHCRMCQRATGGLFAPLVGAPENKVEWVTREPSWYESSNLARRGFCEKCGTPLSFAFNEPAARFYVLIGSLDDPEATPVEKQYGIESKLSYVRFCEDLPQEKTGETPEAAAFFAKLESHQYTE